VVTEKELFIPHPDWIKFVNYIKKKNRYRLSQDLETFIQKILDTSKNRKISVRKHRVFWRARFGEYWFPRPVWHDKYSCLYPHPLPCSKMGAPPTNKSKEGRLNPKGITYLYLSSDYQTALSEIRPRFNEPVSVGKFKIVRNQIVLDTTTSVIVHDKLKYKDAEIQDINHIWESISDAFSNPVSYYEDNLQYVPTQYIAELFKEMGFDGVKYKSSVRKDGYNLLIFNNKVAKCIQCQLFYIDDIIYKTKSIGHPETHKEMESRIFY